jgi:hypothetical protein
MFPGRSPRRPRRSGWRTGSSTAPPPRRPARPRRAACGLGVETLLPSVASPAVVDRPAAPGRRGWLSTSAPSAPPSRPAPAHHLGGVEQPLPPGIMGAFGTPNDTAARSRSPRSQVGRRGPPQVEVAAHRRANAARTDGSATSPGLVRTRARVGPGGETAVRRRDGGRSDVTGAARRRYGSARLKLRTAVSREPDGNRAQVLGWVFSPSRRVRRGRP